MVRFTILMTLPTILEFALSAAVIAWQFDWTYLLVIAITVWLKALAWPVCIIIAGLNVYLLYQTFLQFFGA